MEPFLSDVAAFLYKKYGEQVSDTVLVFPNKRAGLFFRYYLSEHAKKPLWSPQIHTISSFVQSLSSLQLADRYSLLFSLYDIYAAVNINAGNVFNESIDKFFFWGNMLLADFDDIDKSLASADDLFKNLAGLKNIDEHYNHLEPEQLVALQSFWKNISVSKQSDEKDNFIRIWDVLALIYKNFTTKILSENLAYEGLIYRQVATAISGNKLAGLPEKIVFAGFNTLSTSEKAILSYCNRQAETLFFWDVDDVFMKKEELDTVSILKSNMGEFPPPEDFKPGFNKNSGKKRIELIGVPQEIGQVKSVAEKLRQLYKNQPATNTAMEFNHAAIVLPAEYLLFPLLNSLPPEISGINITMGFPLRNTNLAALIESILGMLKNKQLSKESGSRYYHKDVTEIIKHPYIQHLNVSKNKELLDEIIRHNRIYIAEDQLAGISELTDLLFQSENNSLPLLDFLALITKELYKQENGAENDFELEFIYRFYTELNRLKELISEKNMEISMETLFSLVREIIRSTRLPFSGEPLAGIQVMGAMETRCLDFKNLFILSMNEGKWPPSKSSGSFIPYNIRKAFGLPTFKDEEAIYSYNFYRLLQRAENITLFYNTETGYNGEGEKSRYLNQLIYDSEFEIHESVMKLPVKPAVTEEITIEKDETVMRILEGFLAGKDNNSRFSPTALNSYLDCSLKFYFSYVAGLQEPETVADEIDAAVFGNLLHYSLEYIYEEWMKHEKNQLLNDDFEKLSKHLEPGIIHAFKKVYDSKGNDFIFEGNNLLVRNILQKYIKEILKIDKQHAPFELVSLESRQLFPDDIPLGKSGLKPGLKGTIDRIDRKEDYIRIIDYKTGIVDNLFKGIDSLFDRSNMKRNKAAFQLLFYCMLYAENNPSETLKIVPGLYGMRSVFNEKFDFRLICKTDKEAETVTNARIFLPDFKEKLGLLIDEIFDKNTAFSQVDDQKVCEYCPFITICNR